MQRLTFFTIICLFITTASACSQQSLIDKQQYILPLSAINKNSSCQEDCCFTLTEKPRQSITWTYYQNTGKFTGGNGDYLISTYAYSGQGQGYLNPDWQCKTDGPLPASIYEVAFCKNMMHQLTQRPCSFYLKPLKPEQVCGRDDFFIHGCQSCTGGDDTNPPAPGCSAGCIVLSYANRKKIRIGDKVVVFSYEPKSKDKSHLNMVLQS